MAHSHLHQMLPIRSLGRSFGYRTGLGATELLQARALLKKEIADRKRAEEAARIAEARFSTMFRLSPDAMSISCGIEGSVIDVNDRWEALFGYQRAEVLGRTVRELGLYPGERNYSAILESHRADGFIRELEINVRGKAGPVCRAIISGQGVAVGNEPCFITVIRNIEREAEREAQRLRTQPAHLTPVALLGKFSGALAHELNQPLAAILFNAQAGLRLMARDIVNLDEIRDILRDILDIDKRAAEVIRTLRSLFTHGEPKMQALDLNQVVRKVIELAHSDLTSRKVTVALDLQPGLGAVHGDPVQIQQVLLNLVINACEAMDGNTSDERRLAFMTEDRRDGNVGIAVSDTGPGIAAGVLDRLFAWFFTTKANGSGFGLPISGTIVAQHGGLIEAMNNPDGGATFRITLPAQPGAHLP
jgi:two-component system sensor kinase FixL